MELDRLPACHHAVLPETCVFSLILAHLKQLPLQCSFTIRIGQVPSR